MSPERTGASRERATDSRERICSAALALISQRGFSATSVDDIARLAGVAKGTIYYNYPSKTAVFEAVLERLGAALGAALREAVTACAADNAGATPSASREIAAAVRGLLQAIDRHPEIIRVTLPELFRTDRPWHTLTQRLYEETLGVFIDILAAAHSRGQFPTATGSAEIRTAAAAVLGTTLLVALDHKVVHPQARLDQAADSLAWLLPSWLT